MQQTANDGSASTTSLDDPYNDQVLLNEIERIVIRRQSMPEATVVMTTKLWNSQAPALAGVTRLFHNLPFMQHETRIGAGRLKFEGTGSRE